MKRYNIKAITSFITLWLFFTFSLAHSSDYIFKTIDFPGAAWTYAFGINNDGLIVGAYGDDSGTHGYLFDGTNFTTINFPGSYSTYAFDINSHGDVVGVNFSNDGGHGFLYDGAFTFVDAIPWASNRAYGINDDCLIVGRYFSGGLDHGYVYDLTNYSVIEPTTAIYSGAWGINNNGFIVGHYFDGIKQRGFLHKDTEFTDIDFPGSVPYNSI